MVEQSKAVAVAEHTAQCKPFGPNLDLRDIHPDGDAESVQPKDKIIAQQAAQITQLKSDLDHMQKYATKMYSEHRAVKRSLDKATDRVEKHLNACHGKSKAVTEKLKTKYDDLEKEWNLKILKLEKEKQTMKIEFNHLAAKNKALEYNAGLVMGGIEKLLKSELPDKFPDTPAP